MFYVVNVDFLLFNPLPYSRGFWIPSTNDVRFEIPALVRTCINVFINPSNALECCT